MANYQVNWFANVEGVGVTIVNIDRPEPGPAPTAMMSWEEFAEMLQEGYANARNQALQGDFPVSEALR